MSPRHGKHKSAAIPRAVYSPRGAYSLDLEVLSVDHLRRRTSGEQLPSLERIEFNLLLYVTRGHCSHAIDFESEECAPGSLMLIQSGQTHRFDSSPGWDGWMVLYRPEFLYPLEAMALLSGMEQLPSHLTLSPDDRRAVAESIERMYLDTRKQADDTLLHTLLRNQLCALLTRVQLIHSRQEAKSPISSTSLQRFKRFKRAVDQHHQQLHRVHEYAQLLGCSEKTLNRDTHEVLGIGAKAFITRRVLLEAKRLLIHTSQPISSIGHSLGFDEVTNFFKLFKRETGRSPGEFRRVGPS
ncbi:AraC family transcriptional regulator [Endothiovibrio diazotrophicus]